MRNKETKKALQDLFTSVQNLLLIGILTEDEEIIDIAITSKLILIQASKGSLEELKVFIKNFMLLDEEKKENAGKRLSRMVICEN